MNDLFGNPGRENQTSILIGSLLKLSANTAIQAELPDLDGYTENLVSSLDKGDPSFVETSLLSLYIRLHGAGSGYAPPEREQLAKRRGYACHPGGLSPLIKAVDFIKADSVVADLGAGNGLQGLLLQCLCPHRKTIQVEISAELIRVGRIFQRALGIGDDRVEWIHDDIVHAPIDEADFIYLYLPAKPLEGGKEVYEAVARTLSRMEKPLLIFSVADCLAKFLDSRFSLFYTDGHLTCFARK
ncbi:MAG: hypothetical protein ACOYVJ_02860 [Nitrospirota bacterium]